MGMDLFEIVPQGHFTPKRRFGLILEIVTDTIKELRVIKGPHKFWSYSYPVCLVVILSCTLQTILCIPPMPKWWNIVIGVFVLPSFLPSSLLSSHPFHYTDGYPFLICYCSYITEWNLMKKTFTES